MQSGKKKPGKWNPCLHTLSVSRLEQDFPVSVRLLFEKTHTALAFQNGHVRTTVKLLGSVFRGFIFC